LLLKEDDFEAVVGIVEDRGANAVREGDTKAIVDPTISRKDRTIERYCFMMMMMILLIRFLTGSQKKG